MTRRTKLKIKINLKSPDAIHYCVEEAAKQKLAESAGMNVTDMDEEVRALVDELFEGPLKKWIVYREYVTIEIDTDTGMATVLEQG